MSALHISHASHDVWSDFVVPPKQFPIRKSIGYYELFSAPAAAKNIEVLRRFTFVVCL
jgi:hypothetical protein